MKKEGGIGAGKGRRFGTGSIPGATDNIKEKEKI